MQEASHIEVFRKYLNAYPTWAPTREDQELARYIEACLIIGTEQGPRVQREATLLAELYWSEEH